MMMVLHPTYTITIRLQDRMRQPTISDMTNSAQQQPVNLHRWFDSNSGKTGCDEALAAVRKALADANLDAAVSFDGFKHEVAR